MRHNRCCAGHCAWNIYMQSSLNAYHTTWPGHHRSMCVSAPTIIVYANVIGMLYVPVRYTVPSIAMAEQAANVVWESESFQSSVACLCCLHNWNGIGVAPTTDLSSFYCFHHFEMVEIKFGSKTAADWWCWGLFTKKCPSGLDILSKHVLYTFCVFWCLYTRKGISLIHFSELVLNKII